MVAGSFFAFGVKTMLAYVHVHLVTVPGALLCWGVVRLSCLVLSAFKCCNVGLFTF